VERSTCGACSTASAATKNWRWRPTTEYVRRVKGQTELMAAAARVPPVVIYKTMRVIAGRAVPYYSAVKPTEPYEVVSRTQAN
jgi:hypothetical protein